MRNRTLTLLSLTLGLLVLTLTSCVRADRTPTLRKWRQFIYGKVRHDGVEFFDFEVKEDAFRVFVSFDRGELPKGIAPPSLLIKYGGFPTSNDFDQQISLNGTTDFYAAKLENLRSGRYFVALIGSSIFDSLTSFVGDTSPFFYFLNVWYFGCSDPTRAGSKCSVPMLPAEPVRTPTTTNVAAYYQNDGVTKGCIDASNTAVYFTYDLSSAEYDLTLTLNTSSRFEMRVVAGAGMREPGDLKDSELSRTAKVLAGSGERSVDLQLVAPAIGQWMVMVGGGVPNGSSCKRGTGVPFTLAATHSRNCSKVSGGIIQTRDTLPKIDLCSLTFVRLSETRYHPFKTDTVLDADFDADAPVLGGSTAGSTPASTQPAAAYVVDVPKLYAGSNVVVEALVTANIPAFQVYARVSAYPTPSLFDYHFNSTLASDATRADNTSENWAFEVQQYKWKPVVFPKIGLWHLIVVADGALTLTPQQTQNSPNSTFWAIDVSLHTFACPEGTACSGHGNCEITETYQGLNYGTCSCKYGFGGDQCDVRTVDAKFRSHQIFLLIFSNVAILPVTVLCCRRKLFLESVLFFSTGLTSAIYHACDVEVFCLFPYRFLQQMDFALSFNMIMLLTVHFSGARKQAKAGVQVFLLLATIIMATNNATSMANWVLIGAICVLQFSVTLVYYFVLGAQRLGVSKTAAFKIFVFQSYNFEPRYGVLGLVLWIAALSCWFTSSPANYWIIHSIWHMGAMLAAVCFIGFRRNDRYQMLTPVTGVDVLGPNYTATQPTINLKAFGASQSITIASEKEASAVADEA